LVILSIGLFQFGGFGTEVWPSYYALPKKVAILLADKYDKHPWVATTL